MKIYIPSYIDIPRLATAGAEQIKDFDLNKALRIIDLIIRRTSVAYTYNSFHPIGGYGYTSIHSNRLCEICNNYSKYVQLLESLSLITVCRRYEKDKFSCGYSLLPPKADMNTGEHRTTFKLNIIDIIKERKDGREEEEGKVGGEEEKRRKVPNVLVQTLVRTTLEKEIEFDYPSLDNIIWAFRTGRILNRDYHYSRDPTAFRLHTNFTNLKSDMRKHLRFNGQQHYISQDIKSCQPLLVIALLDQNFWLNKRVGNKLILSDLGLEMADFNQRAWQELLKLLKDINSIEDVITYKDIVLSGKFYQKINKMLYNKDTITDEEKSRLKDEVFLMLYSKNHHHFPSKKIFKDNFPTITRLFELIKRGKHELLPTILQRIESNLIIDTACVNLDEAYPEIPLLSIHDSLATTLEYKNIVKQELINTFETKLGITPLIKEEVWN